MHKQTNKEIGLVYSGKSMKNKSRKLLKTSIERATTEQIWNEMEGKATAFACIRVSTHRNKLDSLIE